ncbi:hypothetical protein OKW30_002785 [Paraburkholderia sp. Clong3]|uniref:DUF6173 family protein n=1 Tax=Paraburkholderia sp. Clong3 TaxID=2991061 RepID=UPI003D1AE656
MNIDRFGNVSLPALPPLPDPPHVQAFETLVGQVRAFEATLSDSETVGAMLASFGQTVTLQIQTISRAGQYFCFEGITPDGNDARLVQHYTQASLLFIKLKAEQPRQPIGFVAD